MIANVNEKGRQTKLLAAIAVLAMVICAFAVVIPSGDVSGEIQTSEDTDVEQYSADTTIGTSGDDYYFSAAATETAATVDLSSASGTYNLYLQSGAKIALTTPASSVTVNMYIATGWTETTSATQTPASGTVDYYADSLIAANASLSSVTITATDYGFAAASAIAASSTALVAYAPTTGTTEYYNPKVVGVGINQFNLYTDGSLTISANAEIPEDFSVSNGANGSGTNTFEAANTISFLTETDDSTPADPVKKFVASDEISITNNNGVFAIASGDWESCGYIDVVKGSIALPSTAINGKAVDSVATKTLTATTANCVLYADLATAPGPYYVLYPGEHSGDVKLANGNGVLQIMPGASYTGTVTNTWTSDSSSVTIDPAPASGTTVTVTYTQTVTLSASIASNGTIVGVATLDTTDKNLIITGTATPATGAMASSNVTVTGVTNTYELTVNGAAYEGTTDEAPLEMTGVAFGDITLSDKITLNGNSMTLTGTRITFEQNGQFELASDVGFTIMGELYSTNFAPNTQIVPAASATGCVVYTTNVDDVETYYANSSIDVQPLEKVYDLPYANLVEELATLPEGTHVTINSSATASENVIEIDGEVTFNGLVITLDGSNSITFSVNNGASFVLNNTTINDQTDPADLVDSHADSKIIADEGSAITINNSRLYLVVDVDEGASETINNTGVVYENTSSDVQVGYGTTLTLTDSTDVNTIDIYGTLVISGNVEIPRLETMIAHDKSSIVIDGSLTVLGTAEFEAGSSTEVNGTFNVGQSNQGGAIVNIESDFVVSETGTMTVNPGVTGNVYSHNTLNAPAYEYADADSDGVYSYAYKFEVYGTLAMNGQMSGYVHDLGTVTLNGSAVTGMTPTIVVYQDITLNVSSFNGTLNVSDAGICDETMDGRENMRASTGNQIQLQNVTGATVSVSVDTYNYTKSDDSNHRDFRSVMSVYGTLGAVSGTSGSSLTIVSTGAATYKDGVGANSNQTAYITVPEGETLSFGTNVGWTINDLVVVDGDVNFVKAVNMTDSKNIAGSKDTGVLTVNGTVTITGQVTLPETVVAVNAMKYSVLDTSTGITTYTYTNFSDAIDAAPTAQQSTAYVFGDVTVAADKDVAAGITVSFNTGSQLTIDEGVVLTIADGATFSGATDAAIVVDGTMVSNDYANDMRITDIESDVVRTEGAVRTWTSLYNAINELGWTDITLSGAVIIDEDLTIPAGTTVTTNVAPVTDENGTYSILVKGATLTVEGTLEMQSAARGALDVAQNSAGEDGEIVVTGTVVRTVMTSAVGQDFEYFKSGDNAVDGVFFTLRQGANSTFYITNMANAGTIVSATTYLDGNIEVCGSVSAQDASFAVAENAMAYSIVVTDGSNLSMGILTINGATFTVEDAQNTMFTGSVSAPVGDGAASTVVEMNRAASINLQSYNEIGVSTTYGLAAYGSFTGAVTVSQGTLDIGRGTNNGLTVSNDASMDVASGAVLNIASGRTLTINDADGVVINGTLNVANASGISGTGVTLTVAGTMNVDVSNFGTSVVLDVTGTLNVLEDYVMNVGTAMIVGAPAESLGVGGAISGNYNITGTGYILAYAGADLSQARINWNTSLNESDALTTTYYVNDIEYATVYADGGVYIVGLFGVNDEGSSQYYEIDLVGYDTGIYNSYGASVTGVAYTWYNADGERIANDAQIGSTESVYIEFDVAQVLGTISKDAGIILTIDNLVIGSNGDVSQTVRNYGLTVGTHTISWSERTGYSIADVTVTFNGVEVENGGTITITADMTDYTIIADGAVPRAAPGGDTSDDGMGLTDYLLIVLVVLIVIMAIMVALRLMRS